MGRNAGHRGTFVISWAQTEIDGIRNAPLSTLTVGAQWRWWGEASRIDGPDGLITLDGAAGLDDLHARAARSVGRILRAAGVVAGFPTGAGVSDDGAGPAAAQEFTVTDGHASYPVDLVLAPDGGALLLFPGAMPPRGADLHVVDHTTDGQFLPETAALHGGVICFTPGTRIDTPDGERLIEDIRPGDMISTVDDGAQPVIWTGARRMTGARLHAMPHLRPIRIRAGAMGEDRPDHDLVVSPEHRMLMRAGPALALFNSDEVLVAARDMIDGRQVLVETGLREVTYIHLMTERHQIIRANGLETESFHPANAALDMIEPAERARLRAILPGVDNDPFAYGDFARRNLSTSEAAILRYAAA
ncbi:MAG: Hint domain-containing protein [Paracoccaceae bacterium]